MGVAICYENQADTATLSGGSWNATYVLNNLKDYRLRKTARSLNALAASTVLKFSYASSIYVQCLALVSTNLSVATTFRLRLYSDAAFVTQVYDSGVITLYPAGCMPNTQIPVGAPNFGTGKPVQAELERFQNNLIHLLGAGSIYARSGQLDITDTTNADGYIEAGRLFIGRVFQPTNTAEYGDISMHLESRTTKTEARDGTPYYTRFRPRFSIPFALNFLSEDEALRALDIQAISDTDAEVIALWDTDVTTYTWRRNVLGRLKQLDPLTYPDFAGYACGFQVEGVV